MYRYTYHGESDGTSQATATTPPSSSSAVGRNPQPSSRPAQLDESSHSALRGIPHSVTVGQLPLLGVDRRANRSSATWTSSSDDVAGHSDTDGVQDRPELVQEYNRLARKHGIRPLSCRDRSPSPGGQPSQGHRRSWFSRTFLRQVSATSVASSTKSYKKIRHKRSVSDIARQIVHPGFKRDSLKDEDLQSLVRLCGKSMLYLPSEYAPTSLVLPTCFRATAQYLVQHAANTRGIFRIPGSIRVVNALYDYYCADGDPDEITYTIRCPNLPLHIKAGTHDVASVFKRLLAGLPGGILGSLTLFDALVAIHSQLRGDPEFTRTKQTKLRARLIALAVGSVKSRFRRELICAVFGLLCLIGRTAEIAPREDEQGRPLPTADLMGYNALGIVFGPLLIGELINSYSMGLANPDAGLVLFPVTSPNVRRESRKSSVLEDPDQRILTVDKIYVANSIAEMLITHWREVVKHMRSLGVLRTHVNESTAGEDPRQRCSGLRLSASESFVIRKPADWTCRQPPAASYDTAESPTPPSPSPAPKIPTRNGNRGASRSSLNMPRVRPNGVRSLSRNRGAVKTTVKLLSPTAEEPPVQDLEKVGENEPFVTPTHSILPPSTAYAALMEEPRIPVQVPSGERAEESGERAEESEVTSQSAAPAVPQARRTYLDLSRRSEEEGESVHAPTRERNLVVSKDSIRFLDEPRPQQRRQKSDGRGLHRASHSPFRLALVDTTAEPPLVITGRRHSKGSVEEITTGAKDGHFQTTIARLRKSMDSPIISREEGARFYYDAQLPTSGPPEVAMEDSTRSSEGLPQQVEPKSIALGPRHPKMSLYKSRSLQSASSDDKSQKGFFRVSNERVITGSRSPASDSGSNEIGSPEPKVMRSHNNPPALDFGHTNAEHLRQRPGTQTLHLDSVPRSQDRPMSQGDLAETRSNVSERDGADGIVPVETETHGSSNKQGAVNQTPKRDNENDGDNSLKAPIRRDSIDIGGYNIKQQTPKTPIQARTDRLPGSTVKTMAARFESASQEAVFVPSPTRYPLRPGGVISQYTVNPSPTKGGKSASKSGWGLKLDSANRSITSGLSVALNRDSGGSSETPWGERSMETSTGREEPRAIISEAQEGNGRWTRRFLTPSGQDDLESRTSTEAPKGHPQADTPIHQDNGRLVSATTPQTLPRHREHLSEPGRDVDQMLPRKARAMSFPHLTAPQHRARDTKTSNSSNANEDARPAVMLPPVGGTPALSRGPENLMLHAQIRSLQKQVAGKTEEVKQLRRLLGAKQDTDAVLLREQLRVMKRDREYWRERAERAEKRVAAFKRVAVRMKRPRDNMPVKGGEASIPAVDGVFETSELHAGELETRAARMSDIERWLELKAESSAGHTEDEGAMADRIRRSLGARQMEGDETDMAFHDESGDHGSVVYQPHHRGSAGDCVGRLSVGASYTWTEEDELSKGSSGALVR